MIKSQNIQFGYVKNRYIFDDVSLTQEPGHPYGFLGKNGADKTTLVKVMSGFCFPQSGMATISGEQAAFRKSNILHVLYFFQAEMYVTHLSIRHYEDAYALYYDWYHVQQKKLLDTKSGPEMMPKRTIYYKKAIMDNYKFFTTFAKK